MTDRPDLDPRDPGNDPQSAPGAGAAEDAASASPPPPPPPAETLDPEPVPPAEPLTPEAVVTPPPAGDAPPTAVPPPPPSTPTSAGGDGGRDGGEPTRTSPVKGAALLLVVVLVGFGAFFLLKDDDKTASPSTTSSTATPGGEFVRVRDAQAGFSVEYPEGWKSLRDAEGEERLLLTVGGESYFQVKVRLVDPSTVEAEIDEALKGLKMITEPRSVTLSGEPAKLYLYYTPVTPESPEEGVHVHYFVLKDDRLYTLVFQALPAEELNALVPVFDRVAKSFTLEEPTTASTGAGASSTTTP